MLEYKICTLIEIETSSVKQYLEMGKREFPLFLKPPKFKDFLEKLSNDVDSLCILVFDEEINELIGWMKIGPRKGSSRIWFNMIVNGKYQRQGIGSKMITMAKERFKDLHGWIVMDFSHKRPNGEIYPSPLNFYMKNGFEVTGKTLNSIPDVILHEIQWLKDS